MKDLLTGLAAAAAALATLCALFASDGDVGKIQEKLREKGHSIPQSLNLARGKLKWRRFFFVVMPSFAAFALCLSAIFVHSSSESNPCKQTASPAQVHSFDPLAATSRYEPQVVAAYGADRVVGLGR